MGGARKLTVEYSGWWLVVPGAAVAVIGAAFWVWLAVADVAPAGGRAFALLLMSVPGGLALVVVGLVHVIRGKPVVDDAPQHAEFRARNRALLAEQKRERQEARAARRAGSAR